MSVYLEYLGIWTLIVIIRLVSDYFGHSESNWHDYITIMLLSFVLFKQVKLEGDIKELKHDEPK